MKLILPDIDLSQSIKKKAEKLDLPAVGEKPAGKPKEEGGLPKPEDLAAASKPDSIDSDILDEKVNLFQEIQELKDSLQHLELQTKLNTLEERIELHVDNKIESLKKELNELKDRKIPPRGQIETDGAYKEQLYPIAIGLLNKVLLPLIDIIPEYNLIRTSITDTYEDGTIRNGIVTIGVQIPNNDYRYDFKVEIAVLNGLMQYPTYVTRGRKIIPLTQNAMYQEINTYSFKSITTHTYKGNPFSNTGENIHRKEDEQKFYPVDSNENPNVGMPDDSKWNAFRTRGII